MPRGNRSVETERTRRGGVKEGREEVMAELLRFREGHERDYETALRELASGRKRSHWMWYLFPQIHGLGLSETSRFYAMKSLQEARDYLNDPVLGAHTRELCRTLLSQGETDPHRIFGAPDDRKLCSSMTLFALADPKEPLFQEVLQRFCGGMRDERTVQILRKDVEVLP